MKRHNLKRSAALALAAVTIIGSLVVPQTQVQAASKKKVYLVTEMSDNGGGKTKYTYNKKGLMTKTVYTDSSKSKSTETSTTSTTKYSYTKKDRISKSNTNYVKKTIGYDTYDTKTDGDNGSYTDRETGERQTPSTSTYKADSSTAYTYDKKGNVTQTVYTHYSRSLPENTSKTESYKTSKEISYRADAKGNQIPGTGVWVNADYSKTRDVEYTDNGTSRTRTITVTERTLDQRNSTATNLIYVTYKSVNTQTLTNKSGTTTTYTYDKKKRAKKAVSTKVNTYILEYRYSKFENDNEKEVRESTTTETTTTRSTDTYTYNKKGKATKVVTDYEPEVSYVKEISQKNSEVVNSVNTITLLSNEKTTIADGKKTYTSTSQEGSNSTPKTINKTYNYPANTTRTTTTIKYDKKGNVKSKAAKIATTDNRVYTYKVNTDGSRGVQQYNQLINDDGTPATYSDGSPIPDTESPVYSTRVTTSSTSNSKEVELKKNTARLTKAVGIDKELAEGESKSSYTVSRVTYKVKAKKVSKSAATSADKQQWILQNGYYNGVMGL